MCLANEHNVRMKYDYKKNCSNSITMDYVSKITLFFCQSTPCCHTAIWTMIAIGHFLLKTCLYYDCVQYKPSSSFFLKKQLPTIKLALMVFNTKILAFLFIFFLLLFVIRWCSIRLIRLRLCDVLQWGEFILNLKNERTGKRDNPGRKGGSPRCRCLAKTKKNPLEVALIGRFSFLGGTFYTPIAEKWNALDKTWFPMQNLKIWLPPPKKRRGRHWWLAGKGGSDSHLNMSDTPIGWGAKCVDDGRCQQQGGVSNKGG